MAAEQLEDGDNAPLDFLDFLADEAMEEAEEEEPEVSQQEPVGLLEEAQLVLVQLEYVLAGVPGYLVQVHLQDVHVGLLV